MEFKFDEYNITSKVSDLILDKTPKSIKELDEIFKKVTQNIKIQVKEIKELMASMKPCGLSSNMKNHNTAILTYNSNKIVIEVDNDWLIYDESFGFNSRAKTLEQTKNSIITYITILQIFNELPKKFKLKRNINNVNLDEDKVSINYKNEVKAFSICDPNLENNIKTWFELTDNEDLLIARLQKVSKQLKKHKTSVKVQKLISKLDKLVGNEQLEIL